MTAQDWTLMKALKYLPQEKVFAFFLELDEESVDSVVREIKISGSIELRQKVGTEFLVKASILAAEEHRKIRLNYSDGNTQKMLRVSAKLMRSSLKASIGQGFSDQQAVQWCIRLFDLMQFDDKSQGLPYGMLREGGAKLEMKGVRFMLDRMDNLVADKKKRSIARILLCSGYIECNASELAFVALEQSLLLSKVTTTTPLDEIARILEKALLEVETHNCTTIDRAKAIFFQHASFTSWDEAVAVVLRVRPDLAGQFTDDTGKTFGKKAE